MNKVIVFLLNKLPMYALKNITEFTSASLEIESGRIVGYKHIRNPHTDR